MSAPTPIFELGRRDQPVMLECDVHEGRPVLRMREGTVLTGELVRALNDVLAGSDVAQTPGPASQQGR